MRLQLPPDKLSQAGPVSPIVMVTCVDAEGRANIITIGFERFLNIAWGVTVTIILVCVFKVKLSAMISCLAWLPGPLPILSEAYVKRIKAAFDLGFLLKYL